MRKIKYLSIVIAVVILAGCTAQKANNTATANSPQTAQTGTDVQNTQTAFPTSVNTAEALQSNSAQTPEELQNGPGNDHLRIDNYIYAVSQKEALDERKTYRIDIGTGKIEQLNDVGMDNMIYYDGWIYYTYYIVNDIAEEEHEIGFNRIRPDGSEKGSACMLPYILENAFIQDGYLYGIVGAYYNQDGFIGDDYQRLVRFKLHENGSLGERELILQDPNIGVLIMTYYDGWIYYQRRPLQKTYAEMEPEDIGIYRCRPDGADNMKIGDNNKWKPSTIPYDTAFCIYNDWIYFVAENESESDSGRSICRMRLDGTEVTLLYDVGFINSGYINCMDGWVYFLSRNSDNSTTILCRIRDDGTGYSVLFESVAFKDMYDDGGYTAEEITLTEKYIIYLETYMGVKEDDYKWIEWTPKYVNIYRMNLDGSNSVKWEQQFKNQAAA